MKPRYQTRIPIKVPVMFIVDGQLGHGRVLDVTIPGCMIDSPVTMHKGQALQLKMCLPGLQSALSIPLAVVRWTRGRQFGVEFIKMEESQRQLLDRFMAQYLPDEASMRRSKDTLGESSGHNWHLKTYSASKHR
ncbi:MAG TPA: PilZ domain-containing protein [Nitrospira sp.]|nr:PilZ domain-containing protein [Nitrospira sp.]